MPQPVLDRVHLRGGGGLVHDRLEREVGLPLHRRAAAVDPHAGLVRRADLTGRGCVVHRLQRVQGLVVRPHGRRRGNPRVVPEDLRVRRVAVLHRAGREAGEQRPQPAAVDAAGLVVVGLERDHVVVRVEPVTCMSAQLREGRHHAMSSGRIHCTRTNGRDRLREDDRVRLGTVRAGVGTPVVAGAVEDPRSRSTGRSGAPTPASSATAAEPGCEPTRSRVPSLRTSATAIDGRSGACLKYGTCTSPRAASRPSPGRSPRSPCSCSRSPGQPSNRHPSAVLADVPLPGRSAQSDPLRPARTEAA